MGYRVFIPSMALPHWRVENEVPGNVCKVYGGSFMIESKYLKENIENIQKQT